jgi:phosphatidylglycerophosphate synthase
MNFPTILTIIRLGLGPIIFWLIIAGSNYLALILFSLALLTDFFDGYLARKHNMVTQLGVHLDRWADKLLYGFVVFALVYTSGMWVWFYIFTLGLVAFVVGYYFFGKEVEVDRFGRFVLVVEAVVLGLMILGFTNHLMFILFSLCLVLPPLNYRRKR